MPPRRNPLPSEQVRRSLAQSKRQGLDFDAAWALATGKGRVKYPHPTEDRVGWKQALAETRDEWRAAYLDEPTHISEVLARVLRDHEEARESGELRMVV